MTSVAYETSQTIQIVTLVDITENGNKEQLSNLNTVHQVLQLRSQPFFDKRIQTFPADITTFHFGSSLKENIKYGYYNLTLTNQKFIN